MFKEPDCQANDLVSIPGQVSDYFYKFNFVKFVLLEEKYEKTRIPVTSSQRLLVILIYFNPGGF